MAGKLFWVKNNILYPKNLFKILNRSLKKIPQLFEDAQSYGSVRCNWFIKVWVLKVLHLVSGLDLFWE